jgi:hypothetical protein
LLLLKLTLNTINLTWPSYLVSLKYYQILFQNVFYPLANEVAKEYTETCQKYSVTVIFYYIFHIKPLFLETLFQSQFLFDFDEIFTNRSENVRSFLWLFCGSTDFKCSWFKHKLKLFVFKYTIIIPPRNEVVGGYTGFTMSVRPSVCL